MHDSDSGLRALTRLPRPLYGHVDALPNRALGFRHQHPWCQFSYAARGVLEILTERGVYVAPPQWGVWIPPGVQHRVRCAEDTRIRSLYLDSTRCAPHLERCRVLSVSPLLKELVCTFSELPVDYDEVGTEGRLAQVLLDQLVAAQEVDMMLPMPADQRLRLVCDGLRREPGTDASLEAWSKRLAVSEKTLTRLFLRDTGLTFRAWRQRLRLLNALPRLERGAPVTDVAYDCGYESLSAFISAFRRLFSVTPGEFARQLA
ncbi:AraC family transcriptional regulator [Cupriavidus pinatubonensis]|uniref:HTH-type transcriptional regulator NimR n=1 Tax=Cupriavidus pinatubonensis TaxID=248026 RepID=A0ABM8Y2K7_9BURK|nr:helix-turn-helix transcriptional regulator [Cupriavidus pinatubonensis]CAG9186957.1 HTH-type transcriptional regulator NimR [Cupriavidus pinatubonensis]